MLTTVHTEATVLDEMRPEWDGLLLRSRNATVFQTWDWISSCQRHFGRGKRPLILCVRDANRLVGLAPLEVSPMFGPPLRRVQFIGAGVAYKAGWTSEHRQNHRLIMTREGIRCGLASRVCRLEQEIERCVKRELRRRFGAG